MSRIVTLDFETYYDKDYSLKKLTTESYIRDERFEVIGVTVKVDDYPTDWFSGTMAETKNWLSALSWDEYYLLCHNTAFDGAILNWHFDIKPKFYLDTLSMSRPITGQSVGGSLAALAKQYNIGQKGTEVITALGKRRSDFTELELLQYGDYCKNDTELTYKLFNILKAEIPRKELYIIDLMVRMFTDPVLELNTETLEKHLVAVQKKKDLLMERIDQSIGRDALMSNPKFAEVLKKLGVEPPTKISLRTGKESYAFGKTDSAFKALLDHNDERVQAVVSARLGIKSTLEETRTASFIGISKRGALPIMLNYYGAHTGRASGGDKINLQNLPRGGELRKSIKAPKGHLLVASDSAQIEARVVAWLAGEKDLVEDFKQNVDIYSKFATEVYGYQIQKASHPTERFVGKTCILGLGYGMGAEKFKGTLKIGMAGMSVDIPLSEAQRVVKLYRGMYPFIEKLWKQGQEALEAMIAGHEYDLGVAIKLKCKDNKIYLPNGMYVSYPNLRKSGNEFLYDSRYGPNKIYGGKVIENVVQALARIVVFDQMAKIDQKFRKLDTPARRHKVCLTVHDEIVAVVPKDYVEEAVHFMGKMMLQTPSWCPDLPVSFEADSGESYGDCK
jgi:DNA polymerase I-like protein with 3'-5' exonuclease and polymerase domains